MIMDPCFDCETSPCFDYEKDVVYVVYKVDATVHMVIVFPKGMPLKDNKAKVAEFCVGLRQQLYQVTVD